MTPDEIIRKTKCDAEEGKKLIEDIRSRNKAGYYAIYG